MLACHSAAPTPPNSVSKMSTASPAALRGCIEAQQGFELNSKVSMLTRWCIIFYQRRSGTEDAALQAAPMDHEMVDTSCLLRGCSHLSLSMLKQYNVIYSINSCFMPYFATSIYLLAFYGHSRYREIVLLWHKNVLNNDNFLICLIYSKKILILGSECALQNECGLW